MKTVKDIEREIHPQILSRIKELIKTSLDKGATYLYANSGYSKTEAWEAVALLDSNNPITNAISAIHAIALKKGFAAEEIESIELKNKLELATLWHYKILNDSSWHPIILST